MKWKKKGTKAFMAKCNIEGLMLFSIDDELKGVERYCRERNMFHPNISCNPVQVFITEINSDKQIN